MAMSRNHKKKQNHSNRPQIVAMAFIGVGLLLLGALALVLLPKPGAAANPSSGISGSQPSNIPAQVNYAAPDLTLQDLNGKPVSLADYQDKVVLVNNWATWCPPCKAEMPTLQAYYDAHKAEGFTIIAIEAGEPASDVSAFVKDYGLTFNVWPDPSQKSVQTFRNPGLPNSFVIDQTGTVRLAWTGAISQVNLEKYVTPLLEK
jgi:cytochrome c biogenesis protein CcmG, thiol:disulfide interchange protein DsbE